MAYFDALSKADYIIQILNSTDTTIDIVWTYILEHYSGGNIVKSGPYSQVWYGLPPGDTATFVVNGCIQMYSYAISIAYEDQSYYVLGNATVIDINDQKEAPSGSVNICGDSWEIFIPPE
jgi:hypothetical protein